MPEVTRVFGSTNSVTRNSTTSVPKNQGCYIVGFESDKEEIFLVDDIIVNKLVAYLLVLP